MTSIDITRKPDGLHIQLTATGEQRVALLDTFTSCAEGQCACDCADYDKVEAMEVHTEGDTIIVEVRTRPGETIDPNAVNACLDERAPESSC